MKTISRRRFLQVAGATMVAAVAVPAIGRGRGNNGQNRIRIRPLSAAEDLTPKERAFCRRARFATAADAMRAVASRGMTAEIYTE